MTADDNMGSAVAALLWLLCSTALQKGGLAEIVIREHESSNVELLCHSAEGSTVSWVYRGVNRTSTDKYICIDGNVLPDYRQRLTLTTEDRLHILIISKVQSSDSGVYTCIENEGLGSKHYVVLKILPTDTVTGESSPLSTVTVCNGNSLSENRLISTLLGICITILVVLCTFVVEFQVITVSAATYFRRLLSRRKQSYEPSDHSSTETKLLLHDDNSLNGNGNDHLDKQGVTNQLKPIWVSGLAMFENKLYVLRAKNIELYETSFDRLHHLKTHPVNGLKTHYRNDMTLSVHSRCLYISDYISKCIQRLLLPLADDQPSDIFNMPDDLRPSGLSITGRSTLLVTCFNARKLIEVCVTEGDKDGHLGLRKLQVVALESDIEWPMHAIEMQDGNYVVCHGGDGLWIVNSGGRIIHSYGDVMTPGLQNDGSVRPVAWPCHLAVEEDQTIIVADNYNDRLMLLNPDLKFKREVKSIDNRSQIFRPRRLCLDAEKHTLYIGQYNGQLIQHKS